MYILAKGDSMLPTLVDGEYYRVEPIENGEISPKDIIVFKKDGITICHRVLRVIHTRNGKVFIETKGDNCSIPDNFAVTIDMVIAKIKYLSLLWKRYLLRRIICLRF